MADALAIEHEIQRQMLSRLGIDWTPGEPFYALVEDEIVRLRAALAAHHGEMFPNSDPDYSCLKCGFDGHDV